MFVHDLKSAWCVRERTKLRQFLNLLELGKIGTHEGIDRHHGCDEKRSEKTIAELDVLLDE